MLTDYAGKKLQWVNRDTGEVTQVDVFISCLPASGLMYVEASPNQQKEHFIHSMRCSLEYFGGVPKVSVTDNLKSAVSKPSKYEAIVNRTFRDMGLHYGMVLNPTRPYRPQDKAMVERLVQLVYTEIYFPMRNELFFSLAELNDRIWELLEELNKRKFSQSEESRRTLFESIEKPVLKPLPPQPYQIKKTSRAKVQKSGHVYLSEDKHYYSVPYRYIGHLTRIHYTEKVVEVYFNHQRIATHLRDRQSIGYTTKSEHLTEQHQKYSQWDATYFIQKAKKIGPQCTQYIQRLFDQQGYTQTKYKTAMGIVQLQRLFEIERIEKACQLACIYPTASYQTVKNILEKGLDKLDDLFTPPNSSSHIPPHSNIRGAEYYSNN